MSNMTLSTMAAQVLLDLSDPSQWRWKSHNIISYFNEALRKVARQFVIKRTDIHVPTVGKGLYACFAEPMRIQEVEYDGERLVARTEAQMNEFFGRGWRVKTGRPAFYIASKKGVRLYPLPDRPGTALQFAASPPIDATQGLKVDGDGYTTADNAGTLTHFLEGDGTVPNADSAECNLRVRYAFIPTESASDDSVPHRYEDAMKAWALFSCFSTSDQQAEVLSAQKYEKQWYDFLDELVGEEIDAMLTADPEAQYSNSNRYSGLGGSSPGGFYGR